ncbi:MAG: GNAT family N-acetyltransferase [Proteobacteria bacterium]|nr:GNAT family N-acetyltransferase [Pseudomonadota bacterium]
MAAVIRPMVAPDAAAVSALLPDLGYAATPAQVQQRLAHLLAWPDQAVALAWAGPTLVGLVHVQGVRLLASDGYAEVQALVVARAAQGQGIGAQLLRHAEAWARAAGYVRVRLRSGVQREAAHAFYRAQGYAQAKASLAFERPLPEGPGDRSAAPPPP